jgi:hypothetical protein
VFSLFVVAGAGTAAVVLTQSSFLGAPQGVAVTVQPLALPPVRWPTSQPVPASLARTDGFTPGVLDLVTGEHVITTEQQMKIVWKRLFATPYDASLFDFQHTYVVLMGGGALDISSFDVSSVEDVGATWSSFWFGPEVDRFIAVTATTFIPGVFPQDPPPPTFRVSAVKVPRAFLDHVVFHRTMIFGV